MSFHKIQIAGWLQGLLEKLELETIYVDEQEAIDALTKALEQNEIKFTVEDQGNKKSFLNESGGELAAVVLA